MEAEKRSRVAGECLGPEGVGGRQAPLPAPPGGGGYQSSCTSRDWRLELLVRAQLPPLWVELATTIGYDHFMCVWHMLSQASHAATVRVPSHRHLYRVIRVTRVKELLAAHVPPREVQQILRKELFGSISLRHIARIRQMTTMVACKRRQ